MPHSGGSGYGFKCILYAKTLEYKYFLQIFSAKGETEIAIPILKEALAIEPGSLQIKTELNKLLSRQRHDTVEQRNLYKKMLGTDKEENKSSPSHNSSINVSTV